MRMPVPVLLAVLLLAPSAQAAPPAWVPTLTVGVQGSDTISAFADGTVYELHTAGGIGGFYRSRDHGLTWAPLPAPPSSGFGNIAFASPTTGYTADVAGVVHRTTDGAATWPATSPLPAPRGHVVNVSAVGAAEGRSTVMVAGEDYAPLRTGCNRPVATPIWSSQDGGRRWTRVDLGPRKAVLALDVLDQAMAVARVYEITESPGCGGFGDRNTIYVTRDGGRSWHRVLSCPVKHICTSSAFVSPTRLLVGRNEGTTVVSNNAGRTFRNGANFANALPKPSDSAQYYWVQGIAFATERRGWLSVKGVGTYVTDDGGTRWTLEHSQDEVYGLGVGDADAGNYDHAVIAGPTLVSTRVADGGPQQPSVVRLGPGIAAAAGGMTIDAEGVLRIRY